MFRPREEIGGTEAGQVIAGAAEGAAVAGGGGGVAAHHDDALRVQSLNSLEGLWRTAAPGRIEDDQIRPDLFPDEGPGNFSRIPAEEAGVG